MQAKRQNVALIETAAGNVDSSIQKATLTQYAAKHNIEIDNIVGERAPVAGTAGAWPWRPAQQHQRWRRWLSTDNLRALELDC